MPVKTAAGGTSYYTLGGGISAQSPADGATYYFGSTLEEATSEGHQRIRIPKAGTIVAAEIYTYSATVGTNEAISYYIRLNATTDTLIATVAAAAAERDFVNDALSIAVVKGDFIEIKMVCPTWATNPATLRSKWLIVIKV
jgi:hypothetical protein